MRAALILALLLVAIAPAAAQQQPPSGGDYLASTIAQDKLTIARLLDENAALRKERDELKAAAEKKAEQPAP
jgi:hypothetical protein